MERKIVQDVVPPKSIRNVPLADGKRHSRIRPGGGRSIPMKRSAGPSRETSSRGSRRAIWFVAIICILVFAFSITLLFAKAEVKVTPVQEKIIADGTYTAKKNPGSGELGYTLMSLTKEASETLAATGKEKVEAKSTGAIVIYNNWSDSSQVLAKNTRFESASGKIYRIGDGIIVPGRKRVGGSVVPGSVEAIVTADAPGESYDLLMTDLRGDFKIPGFKGSPKYDGFYARLKTDIKGGASGMVGIVDAKSQAEARERLRAKLKSELTSGASAEKPAGFILYDNGIIIENESLPNKNVSDDSVAITERAILYGILLDEKELGARIIPASAGDIRKGETKVMGLSNLSFDIKNRRDFKPKTPGSVIFSVKGELNNVAAYDEEKLKKDLAGKNAKHIPVVLSGYQGIKTADVIIRPFWKRSFPGDSSDIKVETVIK